jgi:hypothetical protein
VDPCQAQDINQNYGTPGGNAQAHAALLSEVSHDEPHGPCPFDMPTMKECTNEYDDTEVSVPFGYVAFSSSLAPGRDLFRLWVVDSACSILTQQLFAAISRRSIRHRTLLVFVLSVLMFMAMAQLRLPFP